MLVTGRITRNAQVATTNDNRNVVNFSIAINNSYKKDGQRIKESTFINCQYWLSVAIAEHLTTGSIVEVVGFPKVRAYSDLKGDPKASLDMHVDSIDLLYKSNSSGATVTAQTVAESASPDQGDDLPF